MCADEPKQGSKLSTKAARAEEKKKRLAAALRQNMKRRKQQTRGRTDKP